MKTFKILITFIITLFLFSSCVPINNDTYTETTVEKFNNLPAPIILFAKSKSLSKYRVTLIDSTGTITNFGNMSYFANSIGESYAIGDTIKHYKK